MSKDILPNVEVEALVKDIGVKGVENIEVERPVSSPVIEHSHKHPPVSRKLDPNYLKMLAISKKTSPLKKDIDVISDPVVKIEDLEPEDRSQIEVEVENIEELQQAINCNVNRILLDNMSIAMLKESVSLNANKIDLEASGNITTDTILAIAETGVDYISTGAITKNVYAIDFSLRFVEED